jgi:hypothetical protein
MVVFFWEIGFQAQKQLNIECEIQHNTKMGLRVFAHRGANGNIWTRREEETG